MAAFLAAIVFNGVARTAANSGLEAAESVTIGSASWALDPLTIAFLTISWKPEASAKRRTSRAVPADTLYVHVSYGVVSLIGPDICLTVYVLVAS